MIAALLLAAALPPKAPITLEAPGDCAFCQQWRFALAEGLNRSPRFRSARHDDAAAHVVAVDTGAATGKRFRYTATLREAGGTTPLATVQRSCATKALQPCSTELWQRLAKQWRRGARGES